MENNLSLIRQDLNAIKVEVAFIKDWLLDDEANLEVSDLVVREVEESRKKKGKDLISHEEVFKRFCK